MGSMITAELSQDVAGTAPIYRGRVYQVGQIGSLVRVPQGSSDLIGAVTMLGIAELLPPSQPAVVPQQGDRWIQFQLLGELDGLGRFERGVTSYPAIDDPVHFATHDQIAAIFPLGIAGRVRLGALSTSRGEPVHLDLAKLVMRHSAVLGSTGSGKSSTVARLLQGILGAGYRRANIVVIDVHGEYATAFGDTARVLSVFGSGERALFVPYWALSLDELLRVYAPGAERNPVVRNRLQELVLEARQSFLGAAKWSAPSASDITVDSPVPFDLREVWHKLDFENRATYPNQGGGGEPCVLSAGAPASLTPATFEPYGLGSKAPFKGRQFGHYSPVPDRIRVKVSDPRFCFLSSTWPDPRAGDPLPGIIGQWLGTERAISVLDFSGVPSEAADIAIGAVLNLLFVAATSSDETTGIGRSRPLLIALEEAHRFLGAPATSAGGLAREAAEKIAREGRKYGVGLMIISQRPSELSETVLSQCGTLISMRLTNSADQSRVRSALPDAIAGLVEMLPSLRTGEALVSGEAITLPARVVVDRPSPSPLASDPSIECWQGDEASNDVTAAIARWRGGDEVETKSEAEKRD